MRRGLCVAAAFLCFASMALEDKLAQLRAFREGSGRETKLFPLGCANTTTFTCQIEGKSSERVTLQRNFTIELIPEWSPFGVERVANLVCGGWFDGSVFYRALKNFVVQWGLHSRSEESAWKAGFIARYGERTFDDVWKMIQDEPVAHSNVRGTLTFAMGGKNTRTRQLFLNLKNNKFLDNQNFSPVGRVVQGMESVDAIYTGYKDGEGQVGAYREGKDKLLTNFPLMWQISKCDMAS